MCVHIGPVFALIEAGVLKYQYRIVDTSLYPYSI